MRSKLAGLFEQIWEVSAGLAAFILVFLLLISVLFGLPGVS